MVLPDGRPLVWRKDGSLRSQVLEGSNAIRVRRPAVPGWTGSIVLEIGTLDQGNRIDRQRRATVTEFGASSNCHCSHYNNGSVWWPERPHKQKHTLLEIRVDGPGWIVENVSTFTEEIISEMPPCPAWDMRFS